MVQRVNQLLLKIREIELNWIVLLVGSNQSLKKLIFITSLLDVQQLKGQYDPTCVRDKRVRLDDQKNLLLYPGVPIFDEHWRDNLPFYPNFALFSTLGGWTSTAIFFRLANEVKTKEKKGLHQKWNTFFSKFKWRSALRCTPESNYWRGGADVDHTQIIGGIQSNYWGECIPPFHRVSTPLAIPGQDIFVNKAVNAIALITTPLDATKTQLRRGAVF